MLHHDTQKSDDDLRRRADDNLALSSLFSIVDGVQRTSQNAHTNHVWAILGSDPLA